MTSKDVNKMSEEFLELADQIQDRGWDLGFQTGIVVARYYALRHPVEDQFFREPMNSEVPAVLREFLERVCQNCIADAISDAGWASFDDLLSCNSTEELDAAFERRSERTEGIHVLH